MWTEEESEVFISIVGFLKKKKKTHDTVGFEAAEECSCMSRPQSRNEGVELPKDAANISLKMIEDSQKELKEKTRAEKETLAKAVTVQ